MTSRHGSFFELDKSIGSMEKLYSLCEFWPCHLGNGECLLQVKLLACIYGIDELTRIPSIGEAVFDSSQI
jgi:Zn-finger protein